MKLLFQTRFFFLIACVSFPLCESKALMAGAATSNITPHLGTLLDGTISQNGPAIQVHDELHVRCLVLDDGNIRLAMVVCDSTLIDRSIFDHAKALIVAQTGLPAHRILVSATHSHATPRALPGLTDNALNEDYETFLARRITDAVRSAIENLSPAQVGWTRFKKPEHLINRRWFMASGSNMGNPFGETGDRVKMNPGDEGKIKPAGPVDPEVFVLSVQHLNGRPLALLANYGLHYVGGYERGHISADYFAAFAKRIGELVMDDWKIRTSGRSEAGTEPVESEAPFVGIMSNGTSGDVKFRNPKGPFEAPAPWESIARVAHDIADDVHRLYPEINHQSDLTLGMTEKELVLAVRKPDQNQIAWARRIWETVDGSSGSPSKLTRPQVYARETLELANYPDEIPIILQAIRIGELGIASSPCETFAETGLAIKRRSPFASTFTIELANGADGYLPTPRQHKLGGYESWPARTSLLAVNAEPKIRATILELLEQIHSDL